MARQPLKVIPAGLALTSIFPTFVTVATYEATATVTNQR